MVLLVRGVTWQANDCFWIDRTPQGSSSICVIGTATSVLVFPRAPGGNKPTRTESSNGLSFAKAPCA